MERHRLGAFISRMFFFEPPPARIRRVRTGADTQDAPPPNLRNGEKARQNGASLIVLISWFLGIALLVSIFTMIFFAALDKQHPVMLNQVCLLTLGYFGGALSSFWRTSDDPRRE